MSLEKYHLQLLYDSKKNLQQEKEECYRQLDGRKQDLEYFNRIIDSKYAILNSMNRGNPGKEILYQEIRGLKFQRQETFNGIAELKSRIEGFKDLIRDIERNIQIIKGYR